MPSADNLCKQFGPRSGPTKCQACSGFKLFDNSDGIPVRIFQKDDFENNQMSRYMRFPTMWYVRLASLRSACTYAQPAHTHSLIRAFASCLNILWVLSYWPNIIWSFLSLKGDCKGSSESALYKMPHCWKSHVMAQMTKCMKNYLACRVKSANS